MWRFENRLAINNDKLLSIEGRYGDVRNNNIYGGRAWV